MNDFSPIKVLFVDDHAAVRKTVALALLVYDDIQLVGEATNGVEAVSMCLKSRPDVIIMDLRMPEMDGIAATAVIRQNCPEVKIIAFTSFRDEILIKAALEAGAEIYLLKNVSIDELADAIRAVNGNNNRQPCLSADCQKAAPQNPEKCND